MMRYPSVFACSLAKKQFIRDLKSEAFCINIQHFRKPFFSFFMNGLSLKKPYRHYGILNIFDKRSISYDGQKGNFKMTALKK